MRRWAALFLAAMLLLGCAPSLAEDAGLDVPDFLTRLMNGEGVEDVYARFTPEMQAALSQADLAGLWTQLTLAGGPFEQFAGETVISQSREYTVLVQQLDMRNIGLQCTVALDADGRIAGLNFTPCAKAAPSSAPTFAQEEDVTIGQAPWQLPGTLTLPEGVEGPVPAVVLVQGSGPSDRDESAGAVKPFRDLAEMLSSRGIAVLRYDKRTYVYGQEIAASDDYAAFTVEEETIQDAIAAGRLLAADGRIDPARIYVLGHSLGAMVAPRIVAESDGVFCGMILACGTNRSLLEIMLRQNMDAIAALPEDQQAAYQPAMDAAAEQMAQLSVMDGEEAMGLNFFGQAGYYFWEMVQHPTAAEYLTALQLPTLIINGSRDFQVNEAEGRGSWEASLPMDAPWLTTLWADVNHLLMRPDADASVVGTALEYNLDCTVDSGVAEAIADFILTTEDTNQ